MVDICKVFKASILSIKRSGSLRTTITSVLGLSLSVLLYAEIMMFSHSLPANQRVEPVSLPTIYRDAFHSVSGNYLVARFMRSEGRYDMSSYYADYGLKLDTDNSELAEYSFVTQVLSGNVDKAYSYMERYPELQENLFIGHMMIALRDMYAGNYTDAEDRLLQLAHSDISSITDVDMAMLSLLVVWNKVAQGDMLEAHDLLTILADADVNRAFMWHYHLALISELNGLDGQAALSYARALNSQPSVMPYHLVAAAGRFYTRTGKFNKAIDIYERYRERYYVDHYFTQELALLQENPVQAQQAAMIPSSERGYSYVLLDIIRIAYSQQEYETALLLTQLLLHYDQQVPEAYYFMALLSEEMGNVSQAITYFERIDPASYLYQQARINMANHLHQAGYKEDAKDMLLSMSQQTKHNHELMTTLATIMHEEQNYRSAITLYSNMLNDIDELKSRHWSLFFNRAMNYVPIGNWELAEKDLVQAIELHPEQPDVLNYLAYHWLEQDKHVSLAVDMLEIAVAMRPNDPHILDSMGWAYYKQGAYEKAIAYLEKAVLLQPADAISYDHLGDVYYQLDRTTEAVYQWSHALSLLDDVQQQAIVKHKIDYGIDIRQAKSNLIGFNTP